MHVATPLFVVGVRWRHGKKREQRKDKEGGTLSCLGLKGRWVEEEKCRLALYIIV